METLHIMQGQARRWNARKLWVWLHRWVSLAAGLLLVLLGLSGSALVWRAELDAVLNPAWLQARPDCATAETAQEAEPIRRVLQRLAEHAPGRKPALIVAPAQPGAAYQVWERRDPQTGWRREHFIDARCGLYLGHRDRGAVRWDAAHLMPTLFELHRYLLSGDRGETVVGIGGLLLLGLGLSGIWLAWPARPSWRSWRQALSIKTGASTARTWFDVHRAVGLWMAPVLIVLSLTGAALAFGESTRALVGSVLPVQNWPKLKPSAQPAAASTDWDYDALARAAEAQFPAGQARWTRITLAKASEGQTELRLLQQGEWRKDTGSTRLRLNLQGQPQARHDPLHTAAGNQVLDFIYPLHKGEALGLGARLLWTLFGLVPALLLGSGVFLWLRRRAARA
ncbi:hypothetical protein C1O66_07135 [Paucibacter aquatile]|uniref:Peptidase n=1 Tax=Kinneretia aquatilis TaxID=2070761 RepID=A0A2N8KV51_9BURK|nr:PepSY-associated TM helix domain-containing protein [Paucibacter aquatile]PND37326.1 hypothetical protein C1O66_07135 [Paucibacter aquatile]